MTVQQAAKQPAIAGPEMTVLQGAELMAEHETGALVITDAQRRILGIFTERDNLFRVTARGRDPQQTLLHEVMTSPVDSASPEMSINEALSRMIGGGHRHLPVVDGEKRVVGIVSVRHLLTRRIREQQSNIEVLAAYAEAGGPG
ncbi:MAG TPA: CBS domain-containing protein [Planctomycetota bacterium]|nr:CBS domain-containing protein [Planctomycetota bacterium]